MARLLGIPGILGQGGGIRLSNFEFVQSSNRSVVLVSNYCTIIVLVLVIMSVNNYVCICIIIIYIIT